MLYNLHPLNYLCYFCELAYDNLKLFRWKVRKLSLFENLFLCMSLKFFCPSFLQSFRFYRKFVLGFHVVLAIWK
ncbi:hypothetical protein A0128_13850 [Leptospira tipperaryensis]|uniref:Uncharacterized protein n=1 Tax=Leptospira tipperaryensis TaxID=2564040 RepID=A0A1D7UZ24_9LEPT|nr:hypothetical protein A0128_13850 [Leptospira tipperaryensis]